MLAACNGQFDSTKLLLGCKDIDVNIKDNKSRVALHEAAANGHINCVRELISHKDIHVNIRDKNGKTPLAIANTQEIKDLLKQHGAKV